MEFLDQDRKVNKEICSLITSFFSKLGNKLKTMTKKYNYYNKQEARRP
jgi:hypothetical protein